MHHTKPLTTLLCLLTLVTACTGEQESTNLNRAPQTTSDTGVQTSLPADMSPEVDMLTVPAKDMPQPVPDLKRAPDQSSPDMPPPLDLSSLPDMAKEADMKPPEAVPIMVALGDFGRTTLSCDGGQTWVGNSTFEEQGHKLVCGKVQSSVCYDQNSACERTKADGSCEAQTNCDCDHHPATSTGITWGNGWFVASHGWGQPGIVRRSQDGVTWEEVQEGKTHSRVLFGNNTFVMGSTKMNRSQDNGKTWEVNPDYIKATNSKGQSTIHPRQGIFTPSGGGRFVFVMSSGVPNSQDTATAALVSKDNGQTWEQPSTWPEEVCGHGARGIVSSSTTIVISHRSGVVCVSNDGAQTFTTHQLGDDNQVTAPLFDGTSFHIWSRGKHHTSSDGTTWTSTPMVSDSPTLGAIAYNPSTRSFVGVNGGWQQWYEKQRFLHSKDGTTWSVVEESGAMRSHRIKQIAFGWAPAGFQCPSQ